MVLESPVLTYLHLPLLVVLLARTSGFFLIVPFFASAAAPVITRGGLGLAVALVLYPGQAPALDLADTSVVVTVIAKELLTGIFLGGLVRILFAGLQLAGQLAGFGIGLSLAKVIDPGAATEDSLGPALYQFIGLILFLGVGGHREILNALMESYRVLPLGAAAVDADVVRSVVVLVRQMFQAGLRMAAPVASLLFIVDIVLALANRVVPQIPILLVGMPVKAWFGIAVLGWGLEAFAGPCLVWLGRAPGLIVTAATLLATP